MASSVGGDTIEDGMSRPVMNVRDAEQITLGDEHACALTVAPALFCWGRGGNGNIGDGMFSDRPRPVEVIDLF